ncbi:MAG: hypothetical protein H6Q41_3876 [Deltaproteobacteria bacterium]|jgi:hypothetical protein|nr:hypothetical protein [Deltaproteobacteria bacterium]
MMSRHAPFLLSTLSWDNELLSSTGWSLVGAPFLLTRERQRVDHETNPTSWGLQEPVPGPVLQVQVVPVPRVASPPLWLLVSVVPSCCTQYSLLQY